LARALAHVAQTKQYKKGIKNADAILKKFPEHGETLAMKVRRRQQHCWCSGHGMLHAVAMACCTG